MIKMHGIRKEYRMGADNVVKALDGVDIHIRPHEFVSIIGPSGSGKSTLMNIIGCLDVADSGTYLLDDQEIGDYTEDELRDKTAAELSILRNGMYALSGLEFKKNTTLREFFGRCDWYAPNTTNAETVYARFNEFQKGNVAAIVAVEKSEGYRLENTSLQKLVQEGRERYFTEAELENKTAFELSILRNGMYALSGLRFVKNESLREFFENCDWYAPDTTDAETVYARFNKYQKGNVAAIVKIEKAKGYR